MMLVTVAMVGDGDGDLRTPTLLLVMVRVGAVGAIHPTLAK